MALSKEQQDEINERSVFKQIPVKPVEDTRMPAERGGNLYRDCPTPKADPRSIVK